MFKISLKYCLLIALSLGVVGYFRANTSELLQNQQDKFVAQQTHFQAASVKLEDQELVFVEIDEKEEEESERSSLKKQISSAFLLANLSTRFISFSHSSRLQRDNHNQLLVCTQPTYLRLRVFRL